MIPSAITLDNCDQEPIHIPGAIQSLGCLLAFGADRRLCHCSANAALLLGRLPALGQPLAAADLDLVPEARAIIGDYWAEMQDDETLVQTHELLAGTQAFDLVLHVSQGRLVAEFELRSNGPENISLYSIKAQKAIAAIKKQKSVEALLQTAADEIRALTGFDRVMAYRFRYDDSGEVVAEARRDDLDVLLGRRYPASDIPAQARRLYIANTLRLIADVNSTPVALLGQAGAAPLDLTHSVLRSVSPIHIEYLKNMGIAASMSVSIVLNDKLWGMMACHHMSGYQVPYSARMVCDMLCQVIASAIQNLLTKQNTVRQLASSTLRSELMFDLLAAEDFDQVLLHKTAAFAALIPCDAVMLTLGGKWQADGGVSAEQCHDIQLWLNSHAEEFYYFHDAAGAPASLARLIAPFCGMLAVNIDRAGRCWLVLFRLEQIHTVRWGGKPEKQYVAGPLGPRLTPRGSFDEWKETVKGQSEPWSALDLQVARDVHVDLLKTFNAHNAEIEKARTQLMAMLGHDLRDPLHSISMAAQMMELQDGSSRMSERIKTSSGRMQRLVSHVMDMTRLQTGLGLGLSQRAGDLSQLVTDIVEENQLAFPEARLLHRIEPGLVAHLDADRMAQAISNLLSNARHHGDAGHDIQVRLARDGADIHFSISNAGRPIPADLVKYLFDPFKRQSLDNPRNKAGLGLGLYITHEIVKSHGGELAYEHRNDQIVFRITLTPPAP